MKPHRHRAKEERIYGFRGQIWGATPEPRAHGGVVLMQDCACGATRAINSNGMWEERGPWRAPTAAGEVMP